jgi:hypothetical protein
MRLKVVNCRSEERLCFFLRNLTTDRAGPSQISSLVPAARTTDLASGTVRRSTGRAAIQAAPQCNFAISVVRGPSRARPRGAPFDSETVPDLFDSSVIFSQIRQVPFGRPPDPFWAGAQVLRSGHPGSMESMKRPLALRGPDAQSETRN